MLSVGALDRNLRLFRLARSWGRNDFVDGSGQAGTGLFWSSGSIQIQFRYSCGPGHARLCHFFRDAGTCRLVRLFLGSLMQHEPMMTVQIEAILSHFAQFRVRGRFLLVASLSDRHDQASNSSQMAACDQIRTSTGSNLWDWRKGTFRGRNLRVVIGLGTLSTRRRTLTNGSANCTCGYLSKIDLL
jgi:hypothetical protein